MLLALLEEGYRLPFASIPPKSSLANIFSARQHNNFDVVCKAIANHLEVGAIQEVDWTLRLVMTLQVVALNGLRLDNLQRIVGSIEQDSWFGVMDQSSGYYHIQIHKPHQDYLGFAWMGRDGLKRHYVWKIAFLGLAPLVRIFSKLQKPIIPYLRFQGNQCYIYIDDMIVFGASKAECQNNMMIARQVWSQAGWVENVRKAKGPTQRGGEYFETHNRGLCLAKKSIIHWTDSKNEERVIRKGSNTTALQQLAMEIYMKARALYIVIQVICRPRWDPGIQLAGDFS
eukprot:TCALIF_04933-PA protein Name:"Similar to ORF V Enzymatic polyprotein (Cestrum yellow leaf curling virus)" AED:0.21 eAED:0.28 QI:67/0/0/1/0/0/3/0/284